MKEIFNLIGISTLFLFASCNGEDISQSVKSDDTVQSVQEAKMYTPAVQGVFGELTDVNPESTTKSGVIEENTEYATSGEKFYWHNGDKVKLLFFAGGIITSAPTELIYTAVVPEGEKSKSCEFTTEGNVPAGNYTVYGLYPADGWSYDNGTGNCTVSMLASPGQQYIPISEASSKHLGRYMFMKAKSENVEIGEGASNPINLSYHHLAAVIRFHIRTENPFFERLFRLELGVNGFTEAFYPITAHLDGGIDGTSLVADSRTDRAPVEITDPDLNGFEFDIFIPILPSGPFVIGDNLTISGVFDSSMGNYTAEMNFPIDAAHSFMTAGFEAGKSYYINFTISAP